MKAAISDSSPASTIAPRISASRRVASPRRSGSGETPSIASASRWVSSAVPPPTVPSGTSGMKMDAKTPSLPRASMQVTPSEPSTTWAGSWPVAMKTAARTLA